jgi:glycosyltransferase involved in cell wall biosynthesis
LKADFNLDATMTESAYVLITPAKNEAAYIEKTILSVGSQTILPRKWIIVNDGSTDNMGEIIDRYSRLYTFIEHIAVAGDAQRNFSSKVNAFNTGFSRVKDTGYDFIGNLDGDVSFEPNYFELLIKQFACSPKLGLAGGIILDYYNDKFVKQNISRDSVAGAVQFFRKKCFADIGGYIPLQYGSIDTYAEVMARMKGWEVKTLPEIFVFHHRPVGREKGNAARANFLRGIKDCIIGYDTAFYFFKSIIRLKNRPYVIGSLCAMLGFLWAKIKKTEGGVPREFLDYFRKEQKDRILSLIKHHIFKA